ncbi:T9SS type A sorting domain-containing protein [Fluviicola taffensis]|uniref:T9SS type A sorting domain-containing protein n=1 Tax=Fluviicola taffensis TaxID=191579 RepID=UPI003138273C
MKTILASILLMTFSKSLVAQCPTAGSDTIVTYCKYEPFDLTDLRSNDADLGGIFIDPNGDTVTITSMSIAFPGQYHFFYKVSDVSCPRDSAEYTINIFTCENGGISETILESHALIRSNPVNNELELSDSLVDLLEIYETSGRRVLLFSTNQSIIDISQLESGNYILVLEKSGIRQFQRFIKY